MNSRGEKRSNSMKRKKSNIYAESAKKNINYLVEEFCDGKQVVFCMKTGINKGSVSQYCNGSNVPNNLTAKKIGDAFGVDPAWVMGFDVPMKPNKMVFVADKRTLDEAKENAIKTIQTANKIRSTLQIEEAALIDAYRNLDDEGRKFIEKAMKHEQIRMSQIAEASNTENTVFAAHPTANPDAGDSDFAENDQEDMNKEWD